MKVLQINKFYYKRGGSEAYMFALIDLLKSKGHQVIPFSTRDKRNEFSKYEKYFSHSVDFNNNKNWGQNFHNLFHIFYAFDVARNLQNLLKKEKPAIAHLHNIARQLSPSIINVLKKNNITTIMTLHDYQLICPNYKLFVKGDICEKCKIHKYYNAAINKCVKKSFLKGAIAGLELAFHKLLKIYNKIDLFISPSEFLKNKFKEWGMPAEKIVVVNNFLNIEKFVPCYEKEDYFVYIGRLASEKGLFVLLKAMNLLKEENIKLKIIGEGPQQENLKKFVEQRKLNKIEFLGYLQENDLRKILSRAKFIVLPSLWYENYPISLLESFALGTGAIVSRRGGNTEIVKEGKTGLVFSPGDYKELAYKIKNLYFNEKLITEFAKNARIQVEQNNNPEKHYQKIISIYQDLLKRN